MNKVKKIVDQYGKQTDDWFENINKWLNEELKKDKGVRVLPKKQLLKLVNALEKAKKMSDKTFQKHLGKVMDLLENLS